MREKIVLAFDVGTQSSRALLINNRGEILAKSQQQHKKEQCKHLFSPECFLLRGALLPISWFSVPGLAVPGFAVIFRQHFRISPFRLSGSVRN